MPKPGRGGWAKTKVSRCDGRLLLWFNGDPKEWDGKTPNFKAGENVRVLSCERRTDRTRVSWPRQKSHRLFLLAQTSFLCQQPLTNWVTHKIVKRPHGTSICSGEAQRADPSTSRALSRLLSKELCDSNCYIFEAFPTELWCMGLNISSPGDNFYLCYNLCATHVGNSWSYGFFCLHGWSLYECVFTKSMHAIA
jgi:hypothetical protein